MNRNSFLGTSAILLATIIWGMTFAFIKDAVATLSPFNFLFWRFGIATLILLILVNYKIKLSKSIISHGIILGLLLSGTVIFQTIGLQFTTASTASFLTGLSVILVAIFESFLKKQWPTRYLISAVVLAMTGISLITISDGIVFNQGDLWVLLCAFCFAGYIIFAGKSSYLHQTWSLTLIQAVVVFIFAGVLSVLSTGISVPQHYNVWMAILFCSIFASILAFILQLQFQKFISASKAAIIFSLEPVFATITATIYLHEKINFTFILGALLILVAIFLSEKRVKQKTIPQE